MIKIMELRTYNGNNLKDFNPQKLMDKVKDGGYSLNATRYYGGYKYTIFIQYASFIHERGADKEDTLYYADIIREGKDGKQERVLLTDDMTDKELVRELNAWKRNTIAK